MMMMMMMMLSLSLSRARVRCREEKRLLQKKIVFACLVDDDDDYDEKLSIPLVIYRF